MPFFNKILQFKVAYPVSVPVPVADKIPSLAVSVTPLVVSVRLGIVNKFPPHTLTSTLPLAPALTIGIGASGVGVPSCVDLP